MLGRTHNAMGISCALALNLVVTPPHSDQRWIGIAVAVIGGQP